MALSDKLIGDEWRKASREDDSWMPQIHERFARAIEASATAPLLERIAALTAENHNLNWALGTEGFDQMATPEEQAEHEKGHADVMANIDRMKARKERHDQLVPDGVDYLDLIASLKDQVEQASHPVGWQKAILRSEEDGMVIIGWEYCTEAEFGHLRIPKRKLYTSPQKVDWSAHPVAWLYSTDQGRGKPWASTQPPSSQDPQGLADAEMLVRPLYTAPPKAVPLTDETIESAAPARSDKEHWFKLGVRWAEQAHGITPATVEKGET